MPSPVALPFEHVPVLEVQVTLPEKLKVGKEQSEHLLLGLGPCVHPVSFEIVGDHEAVTVQWACRKDDAHTLRVHLAAHFPAASIREDSRFLRDRLYAHARRACVIGEFGLARHVEYPLRTRANFDTDPLAGVVGALAHVAEEETGVLQVLFQTVRAPWAEWLRWRPCGYSRDRVKQAEVKFARPIYAVVVRVAVQSPTQDRVETIARSLSGALGSLSNPLGNDLVPLSNGQYLDTQHLEDLIQRTTRRSGMFLNSDELVTLVHLPSDSVTSPKLRRRVTRTKAAPTITSGHSLILGENRDGERIAHVTLSPEQRLRHMHVIGASGTGKSTFLLSLIRQDIESGRGLAVLDPHGDLIDQVLGLIPEERYEDVVLVDPSDAEYPVGFNMLSANSELEKNLLASDLVAVFRRLSTSWGDQMTSVLGNAILAFLESRQGGTLVDLRHFLVDKEFRESFLATVEDHEVVYFWRKEFPLLSGRPQAPLLTRLDAFLRHKLIRHMVAQRENRLDLRSIMNEGKIFLGKLSQGAIGEENTYLLGTLFVSKFQQVALSRQEIAEEARQDFFLYIDEFHNFITPSMAAILSGARKYHLGLVLAHQDLGQLSTRDTDVASAVFGNPFTRVCFRLGDLDARKLSDGFSFFEPTDFQNLGTGEAIARVERAEFDFNLKTLPFPAVDSDLATRRRERIISLSRERYARPRGEVEADLADEWVASRTILATAPETPPEQSQEPSRRSSTEATREALHASIATETPVRDATKAKVKPKAIPGEPAPLGRGGQEHKYLQHLVKRLAEDRGYRATIEKPILDGTGSIDVMLERQGRSIAVEISITSTAEQELGNIQKCLTAGFDYIVLIATEKPRLDKIRKFASSNLEEGDTARIVFLFPEQVSSFLEEVDAESVQREGTVRGYNVKVNYRPVAQQEKEARTRTISKVILQSVRKLKR
jgi:DNA helicase HerA-like ATPase